MDDIISLFCEINDFILAFEKYQSVNYDFTDCNYPDVDISIPADSDGEFHQIKQEVFFEWDQDVTDFDDDTDVELKDGDGLDISATISTPVPVDSSKTLYYSVVTLPDTIVWTFLVLL